MKFEKNVVAVFHRVAADGLSRALRHHLKLFKEIVLFCIIIIGVWLILLP
jgi:hypothetical protein